MIQDPIPAQQTMDLIEATLFKDQGASFRPLLRDLIAQAEDAFRGEEDPFRSHLGASLIGRECPRELWYKFHWVKKSEFNGRMHRLFNRGHLEEPRMLALLKMIGCSVWHVDDTGKQFRVTGYKGHFGGGMDGVVRGIPEMPNENLLAEFKTHNDKSFQKVKNSGVREAKFEHFVQMTIYMGKNGLRWGLYMATNKNDDEIYCELVPFDQETFDRFNTRAIYIIDEENPPPRINTSPSWYKCKFCDEAPVCHGVEQPDRNCRTCINSRPIEDGVWVCESPKMRQRAESQGWEDPIELTKQDQLRACDYYEVHPGIKAKLSYEV